MLNPTDRLVTQFDRILLRCWHGATLAWDQGRHQTRDGSVVSSEGVSDGVGHDLVVARDQTRVVLGRLTKQSLE
jgi:hypothetical protein